MKRLAPLLLLALAGCAKFPDSATGSQFQRITIRFRVAGKINTTQDDSPLTNYLYFVAIRAIKGQDIPNVGQPQPVLNEANPNGFVAGSPTHFVRFESDRPDQPFPYRLFRFGPGPTPNDPNNPIDLASFVDTFGTRGPLVQFVRPSDSPNGAEIQFDVFANQLVDTDAETVDLRRLQINILTMNKTALFGTSNRILDALGDSLNPSTINSFVTVDLLNNQIVDNRQGLEPSGDTINGNEPDLDITDFSVQVTAP